MPIPPVHSAMRLVGQTMAGGVVSITVTVNEQALLLPLASVARQCTVVRPCGKVLPETGEQTSDGAVSQTSRTETVKKISAGHLCGLSERSFRITEWQTP